MNMDATAVLILKQVGMWLAIIIMTLFLMNRLTNGYVFKFIPARIRKNQGALLIRVWGVTGYHYRNGMIIEKTRARYKGRDKQQRTYNLSEGSVIDEAGVNTIWVFETQNAIMNHKTKKLEYQINPEELKNIMESGKQTLEFDIPVIETQENPDVNDMFYEECLMRPGAEKFRIIDFIIIGLLLLCVLFLWYHDKQTGKHEKAIYDICNLAYNNTVILLKNSPVIPSGIIS
jgi:hypothetical protein